MLTKYLTPTLVVALLLSVMWNVAQSLAIDVKQESIEKLETEKAQALSAVMSINSVLKSMDMMLRISQIRTDQLFKAMEDSKKQEADLVKKIREELKDEDCYNAPIPNNDRWLFKQNYSSNRVQGTADPTDTILPN